MINTESQWSVYVESVSREIDLSENACDRFTDELGARLRESPNGWRQN